jgi:hypothetical protein
MGDPKQSSQKPALTWAYIKPQLKARARIDADFRKELLSHPERAFERIVGEKLPEGIAIRAVEETEDQLCIVVPKASKQLLDHDIKVHDGKNWSFILHDGEDCPGDGNPPPGYPPIPPPEG